MIKVKWIVIFCKWFTIGHITVYNCYYLHHYAEHNEKNVTKQKTKIENIEFKKVRVKIRTCYYLGGAILRWKIPQKCFDL